jgi:DNA end-binding protein Ku
MAAPRARETGRASWSGTLRVGLVSFPVQAFNVVEADKEIHLHQLHAACDRRIRYQKVCPVHGEVAKEDIVSAYEYSRGKYVHIEPEDLDRLRTEASRALRIETFVAAGSIDALCLDGRHYYLAPQNPEADEPYGVLYRAMADKDRWGVGQVLFSELTSGPRFGMLALAWFGGGSAFRPSLSSEESLSC